MKKKPNIWITCSDGEEHDLIKEVWENWVNSGVMFRSQFYIRDIFQEGADAGHDGGKEIKRGFSYGMPSANLAACVGAARNKRYFSFRIRAYKKS